MDIPNSQFIEFFLSNPEVALLPAWAYLLFLLCTDSIFLAASSGSYIVHCMLALSILFLFSPSQNQQYFLLSKTYDFALVLHSSIHSCRAVLFVGLSSRFAVNGQLMQFLMIGIFLYHTLLPKYSLHLFLHPILAEAYHLLFPLQSQCKPHCIKYQCLIP